MAMGWNVIERCARSSGGCASTGREPLGLDKHFCRRRFRSRMPQRPYSSFLYATLLSECSDPEHDARSEHSHPASEVYTQYSQFGRQSSIYIHSRTQRETDVHNDSRIVALNSASDPNLSHPVSSVRAPDTSPFVPDNPESIKLCIAIIHGICVAKATL